MQDIVDLLSSDDEANQESCLPQSSLAPSPLPPASRHDQESDSDSSSSATAQEEEESKAATFGAPDTVCEQIALLQQLRQGY